MARPQPLAPAEARLDRARVADQIIARLQAKIANGSYPRGSKLPTERVLAATYGVSAPTIREALRALTSMGLVQVRHGSGAYVAENSDGLIDSALATLAAIEDVTMLELLGLLGVLNLYVAELAIEHATDADTGHVEAAAEASARCESPQELSPVVTEFLVSFAASAHQPLLSALCGFLVRAVVRIETVNSSERSNQYWRTWAAETSALRLDMARALKRRDREALKAAVARLHSRIIERASEHPALRDARMSDPQVGLLRQLFENQS